MATDFFGNQLSGSYEEMNQALKDQVKRPARTAQQIQDEEAQRIYANYLRGLDADGNPLPAYGTAGVSNQYQVRSRANVGPRTTTFAANPNDPAAVAAANQKNINRGLAGGTNADSVLSAQEGAFSHTGDFVPGPSGYQDTPAMSRGGDLAMSNSLVDSVLSAGPTIDPNNRLTGANIDRLTPVVDPNVARNAEIDRAFATSQDLIDRILNAPSQTNQIADRVLSNQLAIGRSSPGGISNVQTGLKAALGAAPQLQAQAQQASIQEQIARAGAATGAANIYANVASGTADRQVDVAQGNQAAGLSVIGNLTQLTGLDYQFDIAQQQIIGQLVGEYMRNAQVYAGLSTQEQIAQWNDLTARYGIDQNFKATMEKIAADEGVGPLDALKLVLGGVTAVGGFTGAKAAG